MAKNPPNFTPARRPGPRPGAKGVFEFLQSGDKLAGLLPAARRIGRLQDECERQLPTLFASCRALQIREGQLQVAVPNAALATRLRQMLPKLQEGLREKGWPVEGIKLKVQLLPSEPQRTIAKPAGHELPRDAVSSFETLAASLEESPLKEALQSLVARRRARP